MNEADYHLLALRGGVALEEALGPERRASTDACASQRELQGRQRRAAARWRTARKRRRSTPPRRVGAAINVRADFAWVQYVGPARHVFDIATAAREQHIDAEPHEVLCLPFETCSWLLAHQPAFWQAVSAVPDFLGVSHDGATGLDAAFLDAANPWGVTANGQPYFDPACRLGDSERGRLIIVNGQPYLTQDETDSIASVADQTFTAAWLMYTGASHFLEDVSAGGVEQHLDALPNEVLVLPFVIARALLAPPSLVPNPTPWAIQSTIPFSVPVVHDSGTGLDQLQVASTAVWGIHASGFPYFNPNGAAEDETARLIMIGGQPYMVR